MRTSVDRTGAGYQEVEVRGMSRDGNQTIGYWAEEPYGPPRKIVISVRRPRYFVIWYQVVEERKVVLFVSHNMLAIICLCRRTILLDEGSEFTTASTPLGCSHLSAIWERHHSGKRVAYQ